MTEFASDSKNMIFTEDLKNMIHMAEPADIDLVLKMIKKYVLKILNYMHTLFI